MRKAWFNKVYLKCVKLFYISYHLCPHTILIVLKHVSVKDSKINLLEMSHVIHILLALKFIFLRTRFSFETDYISIKTYPSFKGIS